MLLANPDQLAMLQQSNPALAEAVLSGSLGMSSTTFERVRKFLRVHLYLKTNSRTYYDSSMLKNKEKSKKK
jgi:hypothetical protein